MSLLNRHWPRLRFSVAVALAMQTALDTSLSAAPREPVVVSGQATVSHPSSNVTQINASNGAIINWKQFSIDSGEIAHFIQPSATSAVLNRVVGNEASHILGQLQANGRVFLINPNGIVIGAGARIDTNSFIASTLEMKDADFLAGRLKFFATPTSGGISNQGVITAGPGGSIALIAPNIENSGIIRAADGKLLLAAGRKLEIAGMDLKDVTFEIQAPTDSVLNLGQLLADNGAIQVFAGTLRQSGEIRANRMVEDGDGSVRLVAGSELTLTSDSTVRADGVRGGTVTIQSTDGVARIAGEVSARGSNGKGGDIELLGSRVAIASGTQVDASGSAGGGQILVGGDYQGGNAAIQNADRVFVGANARLRADATESGNGGRIILWSNENTRYLGELSARGGPHGGNGGFAEVSGKHQLEFLGSADLTAAEGANGSLLLDPLDIIVATTGGILTTVVDEFSDFPDNIITISPTALNAVHGNVVLQADRNIFFNNAVALTTAGAGLTATAGGAGFNAGQIYLTQGISTNGGTVTLKGSAISGSGGISTSGGAVNLQTSGSLSYSGAVNAGAGGITATGQGSVSSGNYTSTGTITLNATTGSISGNTINGGVVALNAYGSISNTVSASTRIDAQSGNSYVQLYNSGQPLRLGTITGNSGVYLHSNAGMQRVGSGLVTAPIVYLYGQNAASALGSSGTPLSIATPRLRLENLAAPAYVALSGSPTLTEYYLQGTLAAVAGTSLTGASNFSTYSLSSASGALTGSLIAGSGLGNGLTLNVSDGAINLTTLTLPGAPVSLTAGGGSITLGNTNSGSLTAYAEGPITATSLTTSTGNIYLNAGKCTFYYALCTDNSAITVGTLNSAGSASLYSTDNGNIDVTSLTAGSSVTVQAGSYYYSYVDSGYHRTTNAINVGSVSGSSINLSNNGIGNIAATGNLTATLSSLSVNAQMGSVSATGANASGSTSSFTAGNGTLALGTVSTTSGNMSGTATGDITFQSITAAGSNRSVTLSSSGGGIRTTADNTGSDISATGNVTLSAANSIGNSAFANPLDILAGSTGTVSMISSGGSIGALGKAVTVDTNGSIVVGAGGQFHVAAQDTATTAKTVQSIDLSASAAGIGNGGTSVFTSQDLSVNASSDGSTITIGDIVQSANTLHKFRFNAAGTSNLAFGNIDLTTAGYNQLLLTSGGALTQLAPVTTNNISAGYINLAAAGSGAVVLGNVTSSTAGANSVGNSINISGGNITTGNLSALGMTVSGANLALGSVTASGTHRGYSSGYDYVPRLGYYQYVTDEVRLTATGSLTASGNISSATSALLNAGSGITIGGGAGSISGGHTTTGYYNDTVTANAGTGTPDTGVMSAYDVNASGNTLDTGNLTADHNLTISAASGYTPGAIAISANTLNMQATTGGIDLTGATSVAAPDVTLNAPGAILANLTGTTTLNVTAGDAFTIGSSSALTTANVTAKGNLLGSSSITGTGQTLTYTASGSTAGLSLTSPASLNTRYTEASSTVTGIDVAATMGSGGSLDIHGLNADITTSAVALADGAVTLTTAGNVGLTSLATDGAVSATSTAGSATLTSVSSGGGTVSVTAANDINVESVTTSGQNVTLTTGSGNIVKTGAQPLQINTTSNAAAMVTLSAGNGSVGSAGAHLLVGNTHGLNVTAKNEIAVDVTNPLTNLYLTTHAGGTGVLSISNSNYAGFSLTRSGSDLLLGAVTPGTAGSFALTARDGNIKVNGDISNVVDLTLNAGNGYNSSGDLTVQAGGGARSVTVSGTLDWRAGHDILIAAGAASGENVTVQGAATTLIAGNDLSVTANGGSALLDQISGSTQTLQAGHDFRVIGGSNGIAGASAAVTSTGSQSLTIGNDILIQAGSANDASAMVQANSNQVLNNYANNLSVLGGAGSDAYASLTGNYQQFSKLRGAISIIGGAGGNAFAQVVATTSTQYLGNQYTYYADATDSLLIQGGSGSGAFASVRTDDGGSQYLYSGGNIQVLGGSGAGANAEIISAVGGQTIGYTSTYYYDPTNNIVVQAGSGGTAAIQAASGQSITAGGDISVLGGSGAGMTAAIESTSGTQTIGGSYTYNNDATGNILVQGGTGSGSAAWIKAFSGQSVDAGQNITLIGGTTGAYAEISTASGTQTIGNLNGSYYDQTNAISLTGGTGNNAYARIATGNGAQTVRGANAISLTGGTGDNAGAAMLATSGQNITTSSSLSLTGGTATSPASNETAIRNTASGTQDITATGAISVSGGGYGSDTWIKQGSTGTQSITGASLAIAASAAGGPNSTTGVIAAGAQNVALNGAAGNASLSVINYSAASGSSAKLSAAGNQSIIMPFAKAGTMQIGATSALGASLVYAGGDQNLVVGDLLIQGGASAAASSKLQVVDDMTVNSLAGPIQVLGGAAGPASIDPINLNIISNTGVTVQGGSSSTATATILSGNINIGATNGSVLITGNALGGASASITANGAPGFLNIYGSSNLIISPNGFASLNALGSSSIALTGYCQGCDTGLFGPFSLSIGATAPSLLSSLSGIGVTDQLTADILALLDSLGGTLEYDLFASADEDPLYKKLPRQCS